jgi:hypothetical protein
VLEKKNKTMKISKRKSFCQNCQELSQLPKKVGGKPGKFRAAAGKTKNFGPRSPAKYIRKKRNLGVSENRV